LAESSPYNAPIICRMLAGFLRSGLAMWNYQTVIVGGRTIEVNYMTITEAGRRAIEE